MTVQSFVGEQLAARLRIRRAAVDAAHPPAVDLTVRLHGMSMRFLETALAVTAIGTAVLLGLAR